MKRDIRHTSLYQEARALYRDLRQPGCGLISDAAEIHASPDGRHAVFAGSRVETLDSWPPTRICRVALGSGAISVLTGGPATERSPKYAPDGRQIAFLSDRLGAGNFQLQLLDLASGTTQPGPTVDGWVEYLHWSPDGRRILLGVAGHGADISSGQGAVTSRRHSEPLPSWMPDVATGNEECGWRSAWICEMATGRAHPATPADINVWEAVWCGNDALVFVGSRGPGEGLWYEARLYIQRMAAASVRELHMGRDQIGCPAASPDGRYVALVDAFCSDRGLVAGDLGVIDLVTAESRQIETKGIDVSCTEWRSETHLLVAGHRGLATVVASYDARSGELTEHWSSSEASTIGYHATIAGCGAPGDCVLIAESFAQPPDIAVIRGGSYRTLRSLASGEYRSPIADVRMLSWRAPDGLEIEGWLLRPARTGPAPLVMNIHGGPVWHWHPYWLGRRAIAALMLLQRGYALFYPNPRGSTGRGQNFARRVRGDIGGADTFDYLSGLDTLVAQGFADPARLGVTGVSYGGFMTSWLIAQDARFAAAVSVAPVINHVTEHLLSNIPHFVATFLQDSYTNPGGKYFERSPVMHAHKVRTPTLNICGALDRCTPPEEAVQFHNALLENSTRSVLVTYPEEGHGIRQFPALFDYAARVVGWFEDHLST